jgi:hypothetical protein
MAVQQQYAKELKQLDQTFQSQNLTQQQSFALQQNYLQSVDNFERQYNQAIMAIQSTEMPAEQKTAAIEYMTQQRDNNVFMITKAFEVMPSWQAEWSKLATGINSAPQGVDVAKGPESHTRLQVYNAIMYAAEDPSYMTDAQFDQWAQAAVKMNLLSQEEYAKLKSSPTTSTGTTSTTSQTTNNTSSSTREPYGFEGQYIENGRLYDPYGRDIGSDPR